MALAFPGSYKCRIPGTAIVPVIRSYILTRSPGKWGARSSVRSTGLRQSGSNLELSFVVSQRLFLINWDFKNNSQVPMICLVLSLGTARMPDRIRQSLPSSCSWSSWKDKVQTHGKWIRIKQSTNNSRSIGVYNSQVLRGLRGGIAVKSERWERFIVPNYRTWSFLNLRS